MTVSTALARSLSRSAPVGRIGLASYFLLAALATAPLLAQRPRPDSAGVSRQPEPTARARDSLQPPLSPRRAFLYSALVPGYAQSILGRNKAASLMLLVEAISITMIRESAAEVREARRMRGDAVVVSYVDPSTGESKTMPDTVSRRFDEAFVHTRQSHVEDWVAFLIANHLFSGADAYVAANLWDVPTQLSVRLTPNGARVSASIAW